jgi:hypothetical protein
MNKRNSAIFLFGAIFLNIIIAIILLFIFDLTVLEILYFIIPFAIVITLIKLFLDIKIIKSQRKTNNNATDRIQRK